MRPGNFAPNAPVMRSILLHLSLVDVRHTFPLPRIVPRVYNLTRSPWRPFTIFDIL
ncbi:hypothetical protein Hanom_Chr09g00800811 [Helianthus anomalus]